MEHSDFRIGLEFLCGGRLWRCTDMGSRVVVAICIGAVDLKHAQDLEAIDRELARVRDAEDQWLDGPPYGVAEMVFDEDDRVVCVLPAAVLDDEERFY